MFPRFQSNAARMKRASVACIFHFLSIIPSEMGWKWMNNVVLLDIWLRKLTLAKQWKQVIEDVLGRLSAVGDGPVKQTVPFQFSPLTRESAR